MELKITLRDRLKLVTERCSLVGRQRELRRVAREFMNKDADETFIVDAILQKADVLRVRELEIDLWLSKGFRPLIVAPCGHGKGLPPGTLPLTFTDPKIAQDGDP